MSFSSERWGMSSWLTGRVRSAPGARQAARGKWFARGWEMFAEGLNLGERARRRSVSLGLEQLENRDTPAGGVVAVADTGSTLINSPVTLSVLNNDSNPDGTGLQVTGHTAVSPSGPTLTQNADGTFTFQSASPGSYSFNYTISGQQHELTASDGASTDNFGNSVAIDGNTMVIGAPGHNSYTGAAYVYVLSGTTWTLQQELPAGAINDFFGDSVGISGDTIVVGAEDHNSTGAAYVYVRSGTTWSLQQVLSASDGTSSDFFGSSVAISGDTVVVGSPLHNGQKGAAYTYVRSGTSWTQQAELTASDRANGDYFGSSVAISGSTVVVGAQYHNNSAGAAYVFVQSGTTWSQQAELTASDGASNDLFGYSAAIDGSTLVIGAYGHNTGKGSAYIYTQSGATWSQQAEMTASDGTFFDNFGYSVSISGNAVIVGAQENNNSTGAAYIYTRSGTTWSPQSKLTASDGTTTDNFGWSVGISGDTVVVGAVNHNGGNGAAYVQNWTTSTATVTVAVTAAPTVNVTDAGGTYDGLPFAASATAVGVDGTTPVSGSFTYTYYVGSDTSGTNLGSNAPTAAGTYTVVASFSSSDSNYSGGSAQTTFTITAAMPTPTLTGGISGEVFIDRQLTGIVTPTSTGLAGLTVFVDLNSNGQFDAGEPSTTTDSGGGYSFANLAPGSYSVVVLLNNPSETPSVPSGGTATVTVNGGQTGTQNFGIFVFGSSAPVAPTPSALYGSNNSDADHAFVRGLYQALLARDASGTIETPAGPVNEADFWVNLLHSGLTRQQVAYGIVNSPEHRQLEVASFYEGLLHRAMDPTAIAWVNALVAGATEAQVVQGIMDSAEYQAAHQDDASFIGDLYFAILGRQASAAEVNTAVALLKDGTSRSALEAGVIGSAESARRQVIGFYSAFLHRDTDPGAAAWEAALVAGVSAGQIEAGILGGSNSTEFYTHGESTVK